MRDYRCVVVHRATVATARPMSGRLIRRRDRGLDCFTYQASRGRDPERHHVATERRPALVPANLVWGVFCQGVPAEHSIFFSRGPACGGALKAWPSPPSAPCLAWASELDTSKIVAWPRYRFALQIAARRMMTQVTNESWTKIVPQRPPGYLMAPFGWAAKPLAAMLEADSSLYPALVTSGRQRMHLIALGLAHWPGELDAQLAGLLIGGVPDAVLCAILGRPLAGLKRALKRLPAGVLPQASYRHLVELLEEPATAKLIYHVGLLNDDYIGLLHSIPPPLRRRMKMTPRAVRAGLELIAAVTALKAPAPLQTRVGIATGMVVVGDLIGSGSAQELVGETPNLAARLQGIAEGHVWTAPSWQGESSRRRVGRCSHVFGL
jgi:hypothetical protein